MTINILIPENSEHAELQVTTEGKTSVKKVKLNELFESFQNLVAAEKDTGYIHKNLLREVVKTTSCRAYFFKEFITTVRFRCSFDNGFIKKNKYEINLERLDGYTYLTFPTFKFTNILGFISNSNTEAFNPSFYQIYSVIPDVFGNVNDSCRYTRMFPNQFDSNICWPSSFDKEILKNRDYAVQSTFVTQYLSSRFNTDLWNNVFERNIVEEGENKREFNDFCLEVTGESSSRLRDMDRAAWFFFAYYFLVNIKNIEPAAHCQSRGTVRQLFRDHM